MCAHICVGREICYSKVIARKFKLKTFMPYLKVTRGKDSIQKKNPSSQVEREESYMEKILSISWLSANRENSFSLVKQIFSFARQCFLPYHASSNSYTSQLT